MTVLAAFDPGSTRAALVIARVEPGAPIELLYRNLYAVGHDTPLPAPIVHPAAGKRGEWVETYKHEVTREEEDAVAGAVFEALLRYGVDVAWLESVDTVHGRTPQEVSSTARHIAIAERIIASVGTLARRAGVEVQHRPRVSWLADVRRHCAAGLTPGVGPLPEKIGKGLPFKPLLAAHLPALLAGLEDGTRPGADIRDAGAFLLSRVLECPAAPRRAPAVPRDPSAPRVKRKPKGSAKPRKRALLSPEELARVQAADRAKNHALILAKRAANGCTCPPPPRKGRHPRTCPAHRPRPPRCSPYPSTWY